MSFKTAAGTVSVLKGVDFEAPIGKLTMLVGPSGCGKTTLISLIAGLLRGASGTMEVFGNEVLTMSASMLVPYRLKNIGFIFQQYNLLAGLTASENVAVPLVASGTGWPVALEKGRILLGKLGMNAHIDKLPSQLSGGQQQRVAIARTLIHEPRLLLCDKPTAALDGQSGKVVMNLLKELAVADDRAAIVVSHDPRVYSFADRVVHMEDGLVAKVESIVTPSSADSTNDTAH
ncbi:ABC transporter ATP-binding protein [Planctopirus ephydatiae]|nr:ABC transporter ATP-binding protein [Planctopirus ephydatiae]